MTEYEKNCLFKNYQVAFDKSKQEVKDIRSGNTGHTRPDVAINQIVHGMALKRAELVKAGFSSIPYFSASNC